MNETDFQRFIGRMPFLSPNQQYQSTEGKLALCLGRVQCSSQLVAHRVFTKSIHLLCDEQCTKIIFNALEGNYALCLLGQFTTIQPRFDSATTKVIVWYGMVY